MDLGLNSGLVFKKNLCYSFLIGYSMTCYTTMALYSDGRNKRRGRKLAF